MNRYRRDEFSAFSEIDCYSMLQAHKDKALQEINTKNDDYILNVNKTEYIEYLISQFSIQPLEFYPEHLTVDVEEQLIPAEWHSNNYWVEDGKSYPRDVYIYHLPFTGDSQLLKVRASTFSMSSPRITTSNQEIQFKIVNFNLEAQAIKREVESIIAQLISQNQKLTNDLERFNNSLETQLSSAFDSRKQQLLKKHDLISAIGVPIRKSNGTPSTFSVPARRTPVIPNKPKPKVNSKGYKPEPTIDETIYQQILKIIHDVGKQFERLPSTYSGKGEEHLRDHMLLILEPNFEGSATGETFNKKGKTDILLRHEGENVFVAELKYWHGKKGYLETITQLLSYLTWRDSKVAVVLFVRNKDFSTVLDTIRTVTKEHPNYLGFVKEAKDGWYQYRFHINNDPNREVQLAVQAFHLP